MRPLETNDTVWIDDLAELLADAAEMAGRVDRELGVLEQLYNGGRTSRYTDEYGRYYEGYPTYRGEPATRYSSYIYELRDKVEAALKTYKMKMEV